MKFFFLFLFTFNLYSFQEFELPEGKWWRNEQIIKEIGLTDEQQKTLEKNFFEHLEKAIDLKAKVEKEELKLRELLDQDKLNEKEILNQVDKLLDARKGMEKARAELFLKVRMILQPDQWNKIKMKFQNKMKRMREERRMHRFLLDKSLPEKPPDMDEIPPAPPEK